MEKRQISLWLPNNLVQLLTKQAVTHDQTRNQYIENVLIAALDLEEVTVTHTTVTTYTVEPTAMDGTRTREAVPKWRVPVEDWG